MGRDILYFLNFCQGCTYIRLIITLKTSCTWYHWKYNFETGNLLVFIYYPETFFCDWKPISPLLKPWSTLYWDSRTEVFFHHVFFSLTASRSSIVLFLRCTSFNRERLTSTINLVNWSSQRANNCFWSFEMSQILINRSRFERQQI